MGNIYVKLFELGPVVQEEMSFKEKFNGPTKTDHKSSP